MLFDGEYAVMKFFQYSQLRNWKPALILSLVLLLVFGALVSILHLQLRRQIFSEVQHRDATAIQALVQLQLQQTKNQFHVESLDATLIEFIRWEAIRSTADYPGVLGIQLFNKAGIPLDAIPTSLPEDNLSADILERAARGEPHSRFQNRDPSEELSQPLLQVTIPLYLEDSGERLGIARYWIDGSEIQQAFHQVDRRMLIQALLLFAGGGLLIVLSTTYTFRKINQAQVQLEERSSDLLKANAELALAVKTNVVGTLISHLLHDLKTPLSALSLILDSVSSSQQTDLDEEDLAYARKVMKQMDNQIQEIAAMLREERELIDYEVTLSEFRKILLDRLKPAAEAKGIHFHVSSAPVGTLSSHQANLLLLVLVNLANNALETTPSNLGVSLEIIRKKDHDTFRLTDNGEGIPEDIRGRIFQPGASRKPGGSGLGLAISKQICHHLGASLELVQTSNSGTTFEVKMSHSYKSSPEGIRQSTQVPS